MHNDGGIRPFRIEVPQADLDDLDHLRERLARLDHGARAGDRPARRPPGPRRGGGRRLLCGRSLASRFGLSGPTSEPGWDVARITRAFAELMDRLGYRRDGVHGGDWGAFIARELGRTRPDRVAGVHLTMLPSAVPVAEPSPEELAALSKEERQRVRASLERRARMTGEEMGYGILQSTRPQTLAYALHDSPVGQLAWIVEKFQAWTDSEELPEEAVDRDRLLTDVTLYWLTGTANSSARLYYETAHAGAGWAALATAPSATPTGVAMFPRDTSLPVRHLAERGNRIEHWSELDRGGHFPAMEVPDLLVGDLRAFFRRVR